MTEGRNENIFIDPDCNYLQIEYMNDTYVVELDGISEIKNMHAELESLLHKNGVKFQCIVIPQSISDDNPTRLEAGREGCSKSNAGGSEVKKIKERRIYTRDDSPIRVYKKMRDKKDVSPANTDKKEVVTTSLLAESSSLIMACGLSRKHPTSPVERRVAKVEFVGSTDSICIPNHEEKPCAKIYEKVAYNKTCDMDIIESPEKNVCNDLDRIIRLEKGVDQIRTIVDHFSLNWTDPVITNKRFGVLERNVQESKKRIDMLMEQNNRKVSPSRNNWNTIEELVIKVPNCPDKKGSPRTKSPEKYEISNEKTYLKREKSCPCSESKGLILKTTLSKSCSDLRIPVKKCKSGSQVSLGHSNSNCEVTKTLGAPPSICCYCYNAVPHRSGKDAAASLRALTAGYDASEILLSVVSDPPNYHINVFTICTSKCLGCVIATPSGFNHPDTQKKMSENVTFMVQNQRSDCPVENMKNVKIFFEYMRQSEIKRNPKKTIAK